MLSCPAALSDGVLLLVENGGAEGFDKWAAAALNFPIPSVAFMWAGAA